jgi:hypothetical protein
MAFDCRGAKVSNCDVFISYKREERPRIEILAQKLKAVGLKVWFDASLDAGATFDEKIANTLTAARAVLVCWTPGAIASDWVRGEATMARSGNKLVAALLEPTDLIPPFNLVHAENLADWTGEDDHPGWAKILARLASMSGEAGLVEWANMMSEGNAPMLRSWIASQPAGPLRATTRFWLSEMNAQPIFGMGGAPARKQRTRRGLWVTQSVLAGITLAGIASVFAWRGSVHQTPPNVIAMSKPNNGQLVTSAPDPTGSSEQSGIVAPSASAPIGVADGTILRVPSGSLADFESGRISADGGQGYDFEIAFPSRYQLRAKGTARIQHGGFVVAPNRRQCSELPTSELVQEAFFPWLANPTFKCFITVDGHHGYIQHLDGYGDPTTGVKFAVTFFR